MNIPSECIGRGGPRRGREACEGQQDACGDVERVVAQGIRLHAARGYQVVGRH